MAQEEIMADGVPHEGGFFRGLAQAPLHFHHLVAELIDNSIAAKEREFRVSVDISNLDTSPDEYSVTVVDNGPGITVEKLRGHVFKTGDPPLQGSPHLNEHGFGLKNVLAKVESLNGQWLLQTRDVAIMNRSCFYEVKTPLRYQIPIRQRRGSDWPTNGPQNTGTVVHFQLPRTYLQTVSRGRRGAPPGTVEGVMKYLREHLGVFYRGYLESRPPDGSIKTSLNWASPLEIEPVRPDYSSRDLVRKFALNTAAGTLEIDGEYGLLERSSQTTRRERVYYYRNSPESQGADIRIGKRVVATRLLSEIWERARHPSYNALWGEFRINPAEPGKIPRTLNNKTTIDFDNEIWQAIAQAIREKVPEDDLPRGGGTKQEAELRHELHQQLHSHKLEGDRVEEDFSCFHGSGVVIDIFRDESARTHEVIIYEAKAGQAHPLDVYQLRLYWDGLLEDGVQPTRGYLVAESKTTGTSSVIDYVNSLTDKNGKSYRFEFKTWASYNIER